MHVLPYTWKSGHVSSQWNYLLSFFSTGTKWPFLIFLGQHYFIYPTPATLMLVSSELSGLRHVTNIRVQIAKRKRKM